MDLHCTEMTAGGERDTLPTRRTGAWKALLPNLHGLWEDRREGSDSCYAHIVMSVTMVRALSNESHAP